MLYVVISCNTSSQTRFQVSTRDTHGPCFESMYQTFKKYKIFTNLIFVYSDILPYFRIALLISPLPRLSCSIFDILFRLDLYISKYITFSSIETSFIPLVILPSQRTIICIFIYLFTSEWNDSESFPLIVIKKNKIFIMKGYMETSK